MSKCDALQNTCKGYVMSEGVCGWLWVDTEQNPKDWNSGSSSPIARGNGAASYDCYRRDAPTGPADPSPVPPKAQAPVPGPGAAGTKGNVAPVPPKAQAPVPPKAQAPVPGPGTKGNVAACHTVVKGEKCHSSVKWAMEYGINVEPGWYGGLTAKSTFEDFQEHLHKLPEHNKECPMPCRKKVEACRTTVPGEDCHRDVVFAMELGIHDHPEWYKGLTEKSTFEDVQRYLHGLKKSRGAYKGLTKDCPIPCSKV